MKPVIILGGGLWGGLLAYRWQLLYPQIRFLLVEGNDVFGGNHTWSFHGSDLTPEGLEWIKPFITKSWYSYEVHFPKYKRILNSPYHSITSERFHHILINDIHPYKLQLKRKMDIEEAKQLGSWVIDARGLFEVACKGYQKFIGIEVELEHSHGLEKPILMDATVKQVDGFRFIYFLPFTETRILVEDTRYSRTPDLNEHEFEEGIKEILLNRNWKIRSEIRREKGILPIPLSDLNIAKEDRVLSLCGLFNYTTGYSLPDAVQLIDSLLQTPPSYEIYSARLDAYRSSKSKVSKFYLLLNRLMFNTAADIERYKMLEYFYQSSPQMIEKFYSGKLQSFDFLKFFIGKPPISIPRAMKELVR